MEIGDRHIAYFSMEIGLEAGMPTYSGGLGVLAGDNLRAAVDLKIPLIGITLLHRKGYFYQTLTADGAQKEEPVQWVVEDFLVEMPARTAVLIEGRTVQLRCWRYDLRGSAEFTVPMFFLDAELPGNSDWDRSLTDFLYGGDERYRLAESNRLRAQLPKVSASASTLTSAGWRQNWNELIKIWTRASVKARSGVRTKICSGLFPVSVQ